jgi:hypothetical protein
MLAESISDSDSQARAMGDVVVELAKLGDARNAVRVAGSIADDLVRAKVLARAAHVLALAGRLAEAIDARDAIRHPYWTGLASARLASDFARADRHDDGLRCCKEAVAIWVDSADRKGRDRLASVLVPACSQFRLYGAALMLARSIGEKRIRGRALLVVADSAASTHDGHIVQHACAAYEEAIHSSGDANLRSSLSRDYYKFWVELDNIAYARRALRQAVHEAGRIENSAARVIALSRIAADAAQLGDGGAIARDVCSEALLSVSRIDEPGPRLVATGRLLKILTSVDHERAPSIADELVHDLLSSGDGNSVDQLIYVARVVAQAPRELLKHSEADVLRELVSSTQDSILRAGKATVLAWLEATPPAAVCSRETLRLAVVASRDIDSPPSQWRAVENLMEICTRVREQEVGAEVASFGVSLLASIEQQDLSAFSLWSLEDARAFRLCSLLDFSCGLGLTTKMAEVADRIVGLIGRAQDLSENAHRRCVYALAAAGLLEYANTVADSLRDDAIRAASFCQLTRRASLDGQTQMALAFAAKAERAVLESQTPSETSDSLARLLSCIVDTGDLQRGLDITALASKRRAQEIEKNSFDSGELTRSLWRLLDALLAAGEYKQARKLARGMGSVQALVSVLAQELATLTLLPTDSHRGRREKLRMRLLRLLKLHAGRQDYLTVLGLVSRALARGGFAKEALSLIDRDADSYHQVFIAIPILCLIEDDVVLTERVQEVLASEHLWSTYTVYSDSDMKVARTSRELEYERVARLFILLAENGRKNVAVNAVLPVLADHPMFVWRLSMSTGIAFSKTLISTGNLEMAAKIAQHIHRSADDATNFSSGGEAPKVFIAAMLPMKRFQELRAMRCDRIDHADSAIKAAAIGYYEADGSREALKVIDEIRTDRIAARAVIDLAERAFITGDSNDGLNLAALAEGRIDILERNLQAYLFSSLAHVLTVGGQEVEARRVFIKAMSVGDWSAPLAGIGARDADSIRQIADDLLGEY